jgi:hypothetical protein
VKAKRLGLRVLEALREVGVLLMAFGPLEAALNANKGAALWANRAGPLFFAIGLGLFLLAVYLEWRFVDAD